MMLYQLKYFKGNIYHNTIFVSLARLSAVLSGYCILKKYGPQRTFTMCYICALSACVTILLI